ncbi:MAG: hypothetical protein QE272_12255 [Nevskia sp.]|nr:hypothetical protein [Nevskia sp.]
MSQALGPIDTLAAHAEQTGRGIYLLTECAEKEGDSGQSRLQLMLEDVTGRITAFSWPERRPYVRLPPVPSAVAVQARVQIFDGKVQFKLHSLEAIAADQVDLAAALLPRRRCPEAAHAALDRLVALERDLPVPLNGFLRKVLLDPEIGIPFLRCRASVRHHHAYPGGLLVHSTEQLELAASIVRVVLPEDVWAPHVARLGYLLHDIGKVRSVGETRRAEHGLVLRHETIGSDLLAPHLRWLEHRDGELAIALRYVFEHLALPSAMRRIPDYLVAEVVATLDQWSAAAHSGRDLQHLLRRGVPAAVTAISGTRSANDSAHDHEVRHAG